MKRILPIVAVIALAAIMAAACASQSAREKMLSRYDQIETSPNVLAKMPPEVQRTINYYNQKKYYEAALGFYNVLQNPDWRALHESSQYYFAESLYRLGLYQACQYELTKILFKGPEQTAYFTSALIKMLDITYRTHDETVIFAVLSNIPLERFPKKFRNELIYLVGKMYFYQGMYGEAYTKFSQVDERSAFYAKALYFRGIIEVKRKEYEKAEATFATIQDLPIVAVEFGESRKVKEMSKLAVGQLYYAAAHDAPPERREQIFLEAIRYYDMVDRDNPQWFESLFEKTWAATMIGRYGVSLGTSLTLSSPFFEHRFVPEVHLIESITWYTLCKYDQARDTLDNFFATYYPMHHRVKMYLKLTQGISETDIYDNLMAQYIAYHTKGEKKTYLEIPQDNQVVDDTVSAWTPGEGTIAQRVDDLAQAFSSADANYSYKRRAVQVVLPIQVLTHVLNQQRFVNNFKHVQELDEEFQIMNRANNEFKSSSFFESTTTKMERQKRNIKKKAGKWAVGELGNVETMLAQLLGNAHNIDFELTDAERKRLEERAKYGVDFQSSVAAREEELLSPAVPDTYTYWSFEDEYWEDELGYYIMAVTQECQ